MANDGAINRLLYAILSQKCLKDIDWNKVAHDPILSQEITNGHAARMRYSRFKKQMDGTTSMPTRPRKKATPRRSRVEKKRPAKREPKFKTRQDSLKNGNIPFGMKSETQDVNISPSASMVSMEMDHNNSLSVFNTAKFEPTTPMTSHIKMKTESDISIPPPATPSESSRLPTPFLMDSPTSPSSPTFPNPGVVSLNSSMSSNHMMDTSFFGPPLYERAGYRDFVGAGYGGEMRYCFDPWDKGVGKFGSIVSSVENGNRVTVKTEENPDDAYGLF
ncbi:hypothetical protein DSL72_005327 [Monilinia vaccinii-corymbosi]|uniref:Myb-like DNA-binding domain-containing protein n=1 Tax=Monilinia vaccinii-corymbosi TaxID=61207 RepID=A0A8A3PFE4_9HELO|nr:hypothetical protein DSL72_005327 [Monilinia vaccinii-corymbosi]